MSTGGLTGNLSIDGGLPGGAMTIQDTSGVEDQFSAVINVHGATISQIEAAIATNSHALDPHPADPSKQVRRHPIYLVAVDYTHLDAKGHPAPGAPAELDLQTIRDLFTARPEYAEFVTADDPPADGSHIKVAGMHIVAETDSSGNPTGRVTLGSAESTS